MTETLSEKHLEEYRRIYKEVYGKDLRRKLAYEGAIKLLNLCRVLIKYTAKTHKVDKAETQQ